MHGKLYTVSCKLRVFALREFSSLCTDGAIVGKREAVDRRHTVADTGA